MIDHGIETSVQPNREPEAANRQSGAQEGLLDENFDEMSGEFDLHSQGVVFTKQTRRSWAMDSTRRAAGGHQGDELSRSTPPQRWCAAGLLHAAVNTAQTGERAAGRPAGRELRDEVVFTKQTRRSWAMDCYSEELQKAIKAEQEIREPRDE